METVELVSDGELRTENNRTCFRVSQEIKFRVIEKPLSLFSLGLLTVIWWKQKQWEDLSVCLDSLVEYADNHVKFAPGTGNIVSL